MTRIEKTIEINAPLEKVFTYVTDVENFVKDQPPEMEFQILRKDEGPLRVGFTATIRVKAGGNTWEVEDEATELVRNKKYAGRQKGGSFKKIEHTDLFEPAEKGTQWTSILEYELPNSVPGKIVDELMMRKDMEKFADYYAKKTKEELEKG